ncbi:Protein of unknown function [Arenibacter nanhaiticus]|uniref:DUF4230 domain-containing protein n=1 Tax=Arenibacter nanhaiticus TaxID=558155 RepID=A0A1M6FEY7_9FLAO|nr:DUF4230 domain-containing protein [Arenibacter nanhaiticus]SHI96235.1 Protein of unknown function [Arenibacter nanhaiticus]
MKKVLIGVVMILAAFLVFKSWKTNEKEASVLQENSMLLQKQIDNVSKLIVTEGHFSEVYTYKDSQKLFGPLLTADKKALVVVNAEVNIAYDLSLISFEIDQSQKMLRILSLPPAEVKIYPDFEYYDLTADYLNPFKAEDYNKIKKAVNASLQKKIEASSLKSNARNRLISELSKFYIVTNSMGWTLKYQDQTVSEDLPELLFKD